MPLIDLAQLKAVFGGVIGTPFMGALVIRTTNFSVADITEIPVPWQSETYDYGDWFDVGVKDTVFTVPAGVLRVRVTGGISWTSGGPAVRLARMQKNGLVFDGAPRVVHDAQSVSIDGFSLESAVVEVVEGDEFRIRVSQVSGGTLFVDNNHSFFAIEKIS